MIIVLIIKNKNVKIRYKHMVLLIFLDVQDKYQMVDKLLVDIVILW